MAVLFGHDLGDQEPVTGAQLRAMRASNLRPRLHELAGLPTLVVNATHDPIAPPPVGRTIADDIRGARFVEAAGASHGLPITHAAWTNGLLAEHFAASAIDEPSGSSYPTPAASRWTESPSGQGR
jgi:pimeloyl-ACP methyl ester carboxylesterase